MPHVICAFLDMSKFIPLVFSAVLALSACSEPNTNLPASQTQTESDYAKLSGQTMGTSYHISFKNNGLDTNAIQRQIDDKLITINKSMSTYDDTATIMAFNRAKAGEVIAIDDDFKKVLADSRTIFKASDGAFDPTVMPLVLLWGFGKELTTERLNNPPSKDEIAKVRTLIGLDKVLDDADGIKKATDGVGLDFSAIAKGYGVDKVAQVLSENGVSDYMVEIGGEVATKGNNPNGKAWTIGIDMPTINSTVTNRELLTALPLNNDHLATSGSYRNFLEYNGVHYSHTIDPKTAYPVVGSALSVTVLASTTALADGWATALSAMPMEQAINLAEKENLAVLFVGHKGTNKHQFPFVIVQSSAFKAKFPQLNLPAEK